jgi:hypothetical protein
MIIGNSNIGRKMKKLMFIVVLLIASASLYSQGLDTVWTYNLMPNQLTNAVFSPDEQYVFATHYYIDPNNNKKFVYLSKFDKNNGNLMWTTDTIIGLKQFSEDGKSFYTYDMERFSYPEFLKLNPPIIPKGIKFNLSMYELDENTQLMYTINNNGVAKLPMSKSDYDSTIAIFDLKNIEYSKYIPLNDSNKFVQYIHTNKNSNNFVLISFNSYEFKKEYYNNFFVDLWDKKTNKFVRNIYSMLNTQFSDMPIVKYSPDGKLLGILTDSLRLYETGNYNWGYTFPILWPRYFNFSMNSKNVYISTLGNFIQLYNIDSKNIIYSNNFIYTKRFINEGANNEFLTSWLADKLTLIRINPTSIDANRGDSKLKNIDNIILEICCFDLGGEYVNYSITDLSGNIIVDNFKTGIRSDNSIIVDINKLSNGVYLINFNLNNENLNYKFIVVR